MIARYTFAVCSRCGVQSPPLIDWDFDRLVRVGWRIAGSKYAFIATCPSCVDAERKEAEDPDRAA
jgi:hypothetical protein